ncbi:MAG: hypothetical protein WCG51_02735 [Elusimicrobiota bacterium]
MCPRNILFINKDTGTCAVSDETKCDKLRGCERVCMVDAIKIH